MKAEKGMLKEMIPLMEPIINGVGFISGPCVALLATITINRAIKSNNIKKTVGNEAASVQLLVRRLVTIAFSMV